ncbi:MAG TPA: hypothetical protein VFH47_02815 [Candidatus Thermoplasmatota archaeon]|nr:hypothetical protein [Candidatus Thermoplasmatota archaeon]
MTEKKQINTARKGAACERLAQKVMQAQGYSVRRSVRSVVRVRGGWISHAQDFWGCDLMGTVEGRPLRLVQVTSGPAVTTKRKKLMATVFPACVVVEIWRWVVPKRPGVALEPYFQCYVGQEDFRLNPCLRLYPRDYGIDWRKYLG